MYSGNRSRSAQVAKPSAGGVSSNDTDHRPRCASATDRMWTTTHGVHGTAVIGCSIRWRGHGCWHTSSSLYRYLKFRSAAGKQHNTEVRGLAGYMMQMTNIAAAYFCEWSLHFAIGTPCAVCGRLGPVVQPARTAAAECNESTWRRCRGTPNPLPGGGCSPILTRPKSYAGTQGASQ